jgi:hypothetical protein
MKQPFKIAFCFSGQLRTWRKCIHTWQDMFKDLKHNHNVSNIDVFCHIWDHNTLQQGIAHEKIILDTLDDASVLSESEINDYIQQLGPTAYKIDNVQVSKSIKQQTNDRSLISGEQPRQWRGHFEHGWMASQFYSIMYAAHLKKMHEIKHNFNYDVCVRMRNDLYLGDSLADLSIDNMLHPKFNTVYSCHTGVDNSQWFGRRLGNIFWCADSPTFDKMSHFYHWLPTLGDQEDHYGPEHSFYYYAKMFNILVDALTDNPKIARDADYVKLKQDSGTGLLGEHEILC